MELWDAYDRGENKLGFDIVRGEPIAQGVYHLVCEVLVRHRDGDFLLMRRDPRKESYPGRYEATAGGSALKGEDPLTCIKRELYEETGISADGFTEVARVLTADSIHHCFVVTTDCDKSAIRLQEGETTAFLWLDETAFVAFLRSDSVIASQRDRFAPYYKRLGNPLK